MFRTETRGLVQTLFGATSIAINFIIRKDVVRKLTLCREDIADRTLAIGLCIIFKILEKEDTITK